MPFTGTSFQNATNYRELFCGDQPLFDGGCLEDHYMRNNYSVLHGVMRTLVTGLVPKALIALKSKD